jgi:hypothetical protein
MTVVPQYLEANLKPRNPFTIRRLGSPKRRHTANHFRQQLPYAPSPLNLPPPQVNRQPRPQPCQLPRRDPLQYKMRLLQGQLNTTNANCPPTLAVSRQAPTAQCHQDTQKDKGTASNGPYPPIQSLCQHSSRPLPPTHRRRHKCQRRWVDPKLWDCRSHRVNAPSVVARVPRTRQVKHQGNITVTWIA